MNKTVLFLDFDDVICLNRDVGAYDALEAIKEIQQGECGYRDFSTLWKQLFDSQAIANLQAIHATYRPSFVLSTSWTRFFDKEALVEILKHAGLQWVADSLHEDWKTVENPSSQLRALEIASWLARHPEAEGSWLVLDDEESGIGLAEWPIEADRQYITLCQRQVGLMRPEFEKLRLAFESRCANLECCE